MTLATLEAELYRRLNYATSPATEVTTRLRSFLNLTQRQILGLPGLDRLRDDTITFASVNAVAQYGLPQAVMRIQGLSERTNNRRLTARSLSWLREVDPGLTNTGTPEYYIPIGIQAVNRQPSDASEIFVDSTSASDTNTAYLEAIRSGGYRIVLSVSMTGVTAVSLGAAYTDIVEVTKFYLSAAAVGTVTLHEDASGGTELARIPIGQTFARYEGIQLWPTPSAAVTYYVDYTRTIPDMANANDEPLLPEDFHWLLIEGALVKEWTKKDDVMRRELAETEFRTGLSALRYHVTAPPDLLPARSDLGERVSRFGAHYPAGRW